MKYLTWFKENINLISFISGVLMLVNGKEDIGRILIQRGGVL